MCVTGVCVRQGVREAVMMCVCVRVCVCGCVWDTVFCTLGNFLVLLSLRNVDYFNAHGSFLDAHTIEVLSKEGNKVCHMAV